MVKDHSDSDSESKPAAATTWNISTYPLHHERMLLPRNAKTVYTQGIYTLHTSKW